MKSQQKFQQEFKSKDAPTQSGPLINQHKRMAMGQSIAGEKKGKK